MTSRQRRIAFYAPLKPPDHPSPSGDRQMARQIIDALGRAGHEVNLASRLRSYLRDSNDSETRDSLLIAAETEIERLDAEWVQKGPPDLWLCYHPYYKSPDLIGPTLCSRHVVPWVTVEASLSARRGIGLWQDWQARAQGSVEGAAVNISLTGRDAEGLARIVPRATIARLPPFIDDNRFAAIEPAPEPGALLAIAMMRPGDKVESYSFLAAALARIQDLPWQLSVIGDGAARDTVHRAFASLAPDRINWRGQLGADEIAAELTRAAILVWPGWGEAFGLAYLEAQAAGVPVVAQAVAGVPEVVAHGETGILTAPSDVDAFAQAIRQLLRNDEMRQRMGTAARTRVASRHSMNGAARQVQQIFRTHVWR